MARTKQQAYALNALHTAAGNLNRALGEVRARATEDQEALRKGVRTQNGGYMGRYGAEVQAHAAQVETLLTTCSALGCSDDDVAAAYRPDDRAWFAEEEPATVDTTAYIAAHGEHPQDAGSTYGTWIFEAAGREEQAIRGHFAEAVAALPAGHWTVQP